MAAFVRYCSVEPGSRGTRPGVFALVNGLAADGALDAEERTWWRAANDWYDAAYLDPGSVDPTVYDRSVHPVAEAWFRVEATHLLERVGQYTDVLDRHGIRWQRLSSGVEPGRVVYSDADQVVVVPEARA